MNRIFESVHAAKIVFYVCLTVAAGLFIGGFLVPPMGVIDGSVLKAGGILLCFGALGIFGRALDQGKTAKFEKGDIEVTVGDDDNKD